MKKLYYLSYLCSSYLSCYLSTMSFSSCVCYSSFSLEIDYSRSVKKPSNVERKDQITPFAVRSSNTDLFGDNVMGLRSNRRRDWSFKGGSRAICGTIIHRYAPYRKSSTVSTACFAGPQTASIAFTWGTVAVLPFYTLMVLAPRAELTKNTIGNGIPYVVLGLLYVYLLYLSWTPDTLRLMFASQYWLPELSGMIKMFSSEMSLASAWIHLLAIDLYAARQVFHDGLENNVETRHSVSLCLLFCPIGIICHVITKALTNARNN